VRRLGTGEECLPAVDACQHHLLDFSCGQRKPNDLEKEFFLTERCGNVYENKGPLLTNLERSWNVLENKGTYTFKAGMLMKTNDLYCMS
jgi:hypothetical protein